MLLFLLSLPFIPLTNPVLTAQEESRLENGTFQVLRITPANEAQLALLNVLWNNDEDLKLDFWMPPIGVGAKSDVMVPPSLQASVRSLLLHNQIPFEVIIPDVHKLIEEEKRVHSSDFNRLFQDDSSRAYYNFRKYGSFPTMLDYMEKVRKENPRIAKLITLGKTHENRSITGIKIGVPSSSKKAIWVDGGIHAREWAAPHTALYFIHQLVKKYRRDKRITHFVRNLDWYIVPILNPDGYEHSRSSSRPEVRFWRKNRSPVPSDCEDREGCCQGVDLNRNFDFHWGESGSSSNTCSNNYKGARAFSEPESRAVRDFVLPRAKDIDAFITFHTYGQIWVHSFGHKSGSYPPDVKDINKLGLKAAKAMKKLYGMEYEVGSAGDMLRPAAGGSDDWAKDKAGIKFVFLPELRPMRDESRAYILDEEQLLPTCRESFEGVAVVAEEVLRRAGKQYRKSRPSSRTAGRGRGSCSDRQPGCRRWLSSRRSLCTRLHSYMRRKCRKSCKFC